MLWLVFQWTGNSRNFRWITFFLFLRLNFLFCAFRKKLITPDRWAFIKSSNSCHNKQLETTVSSLFLKASINFFDLYWLVCYIKPPFDRAQPLGKCLVMPCESQSSFHKTPCPAKCFGNLALSSRLIISDRILAFSSPSIAVLRSGTQVRDIMRRAKDKSAEIDPQQTQNNPFWGYHEEPTILSF